MVGDDETAIAGEQQLAVLQPGEGGGRVARGCTVQSEWVSLESHQRLGQRDCRWNCVWVSKNLGEQKKEKVKESRCNCITSS